MEKIVGLITEYNPFHNGHLLHLNKSKELTGANYTICVMSGNYVQRGAPAFLDKWQRTKMALENGVDLVIELPTYFSTGSAEVFSHAAIKLLDDTGIVSHVCFGSETGEIQHLNKVASILVSQPKIYSDQLKENLSQGFSFATARSKALFAQLSSMSTSNEKNFEVDSFELFNRFVSSPNNILGIEYLKSLTNLKSSIEPVTFSRQGAHYHDTETQHVISSATGIRESYFKHSEITSMAHALPKASFKVLENAIAQGRDPIHLDDFSPYLFYMLAYQNEKDLSSICEISEGLENRILKYAQEAKSISELVQLVGTKRYTSTRINRALLNIILGIKTADVNQYKSNGFAPYIKVLGFKKDSQHLLKLLQHNCQLPLILNVKKDLQKLPSSAQQMLYDEMRFTNLYSLLYKNKDYSKRGLEYTTPLVII